MENRYQVITVYGVADCKTESTSDLMSALRAAAIYWEDPDCSAITIWDWEAYADVMHYQRPNKV